MSSDYLSDDDITRLEFYVRDMRRRRALGEALSKSDFIEWARQATAWVLDKLEYAWNWVRRTLGLT